MNARIILVLSLIFTGCAAHPSPTPVLPPAAPKPSAPPGTAPAVPLPPETLPACLARTGTHLYGASWCHWCHVQLKLFGNEASAVPYTDCDPDASLSYAQECLDAGVVPYETPLPLWIFPDGSRLVGVRSLDVLAARSGCPAPP